MNNFHYISVLLDMLYGIEMEDEDVEEIGLLAWQLIGNKRVRLYRYCADIDKKDLSITLPCNALTGTGADGGIIEAVTASYEDWERSSNYTDYGNFRSGLIENAIEREKYYNSPYYIPGKLLKYEQVGDKLYFTRNYGRVHVLYKGILADDEGLPELTDKEALAIATYVAYTQKFKEGLITNNKDVATQGQLLRQQWLQQCDQARVTYLNQNDMNNILDAKNSWHRHTYGKSTKPIP